MHIEITGKLLVVVTLCVSSLRGTSAASTHRRYRRQVPQEWAHAKEVRLVDDMLKLGPNPLEFKHPIYSLLGLKAAAEGMGKLEQSSHDCFQKLVADQAFSNAKKAGKKEGQEAAIIFASVEKNTKTVGVASPPCKTKKMENPEIERLIQHQDAASPGAAENNKKSALLAALSLKEIGSDPSIALRTGTFKAGDPKSPNNGRGGSCDEENDAEGCIYSKKLLVEDVTKAEIDEFLKNNGGSGGTKESGSTEKDKKPESPAGKPSTLTDVVKKEGGGATKVLKDAKGSKAGDATKKEDTKSVVLKDEKPNKTGAGGQGTAAVEKSAALEKTENSGTTAELTLVDESGKADNSTTKPETTPTKPDTTTVSLASTEKSTEEKEKEEKEKKEKEEKEKKEKEEKEKKEKDDKPKEADKTKDDKTQQTGQEKSKTKTNN
ncbi:hypothetical protein PGT21_006968 [Puccinia graminis f. sp. tritici]|uniref:Uncharacterized protein n=2 Tax=Puccinia graminis f. sp. tritici TaxID=56615 RepID=E3KXX9_PUCGT|nr:uncharacterized protein PGTG_15021 [Puccinia graminis f. sp. tritici CRL 75-36-700-3]EFP89180.1 hypothetical protein PGTG_15021 [Puccinia graminis f. sp. tritici CRL 75-36-700-3]KAA1108293.1 hypothetical protein PGT21_006968 [Puccinia graminis f. sp. tritici]